MYGSAVQLSNYELHHYFLSPDIIVWKYKEIFYASVAQ